MRLTAAIALSFVAAAADSPGLIPFEKDGNWGYKSPQGKVVIEPRFSMAGQFSNGIAAVADSHGWAYIDRSARVVVRPFVFDNVSDDFREGLARFTANGKFGFFDRRGRVVIPATFDFAEPFSGGRAAVCQGCRKVAHGEHWSMEGGQWSFINRAGLVKR